jgi:DNA-binding response OmpR family regulator
VGGRLAKPFTEDALQARIGALLDRQERREWRTAICGVAALERSELG